MNLWILTEERPKRNVLELILRKVSSDRGQVISFNNLQISPMINNNHFIHIYNVSGFNSNLIQTVRIKIVSGKKSFVDFLVFEQDSEPNQNSIPTYAIEETKTTDEESRNTGVYQRGSKFVYIDLFYPRIRKVMLYNYQVNHSSTHSTDTNIFGTRMLLTLGVEIIGRTLNADTFSPFQNLNELVSFKNRMRRPPRGNTPILITINQTPSFITVSGRLDKPQSPHSIIHDPNIGALSLIIKCIRQLGWNAEIRVTQHNILQPNVGRGNKFVSILNMLNATMEGLQLPPTPRDGQYWYYDNSSEKLVTIFIHLICEMLPNVQCIYENHAGCERGYFRRSNGNVEALPKRDQNGDMLNIPDLIICDHNNQEILLIEGKKRENIVNGLNDLDNYDPIENEWIRPNYPQYRIKRFVVLYGGIHNITNIERLAFILSDDGELHTSQHTPSTIINAKNNILRIR